MNRQYFGGLPSDAYDRSHWCNAMTITNHILDRFGLSDEPPSPSLRKNGAVANMRSVGLVRRRTVEFAMASVLLAVAAATRSAAGTHQETAPDPLVGGVQLWGHLRGCVAGVSDDRMVTVYGNGRARFGAGRPHGLVYCLKLDLDSGGFDHVWSTTHAFPSRGPESALEFAASAGELPPRLVHKKNGQGYVVFDAESGQRLLDVRGERLLTHANADGHGYVRATVSNDRFRLLIDRHAVHKVVETELEHPQAAVLIGTDPELRFLVLRSQPVPEKPKADRGSTDSPASSDSIRRPSPQRTMSTLSIVDVAMEGTTKVMDVWRAPTLQVDWARLDYCEGAFGISLWDSASMKDGLDGRFIVAGHLDLDARSLKSEVTMLRETEKTVGHVYYDPSFGRGSALCGEMLLVSRPGDPESSVLMGHSFDDGSLEWRIDGAFGANLGTRIESFGDEFALVSGGGLGASLYHENGRVHVYGLRGAASPEHLMTIRENEVSEALRAARGWSSR